MEISCACFGAKAPIFQNFAKLYFDTMKGLGCIIRLNKSKSQLNAKKVELDLNWICLFLVLKPFMVITTKYNINL